MAANRDRNDFTTGGYYFYDLNAKINHKFSEKSRLYLSSYMGRDRAYSRNRSSLSSMTGTMTDMNIKTAMAWDGAT
jgi:hypothetical protein